MSEVASLGAVLSYNADYTEDLLTGSAGVTNIWAGKWGATMSGENPERHMCSQGSLSYAMLWPCLKI